MTTFPILQALLSDIVLVNDDEILEAVRFALLRKKIVLEPTGALPLAAVLQNRIPSGLRRVGVIASGGNIDPGLLTRLFDA